MIIAIVVYRIKRYCASWRETLAEKLESLGYKLSRVDADVWMKRDFKPNGDPYHKYMLC